MLTDSAKIGIYVLGCSWKQCQGRKLFKVYDDNFLSLRCKINLKTFFMKLVYAFSLVLLFLSCSGSDDSDSPQQVESTATFEIVDLETARLEANIKEVMSLEQGCQFLELATQQFMVGNHTVSTFQLGLGPVGVDFSDTHTYYGEATLGMTGNYDGIMTIDGMDYTPVQMQMNITDISEESLRPGEGNTVVGHYITGVVIYILNNANDEFVTVTVRLNNYLVDPDVFGC